MEFLSLFKNSQKPANNNLNVGQKRKRQSTRIVNEPYLYGMAFYISQEMFERYIGITYVSNRICIAFFELGQTTTIDASSKKSVLAVINAYAPQSGRAWQETPDGITEIEAFYSDLEQTVTKTNQLANITIIMGDFNAKIGTKVLPEESLFMGSYGKGRRNRSGDTFAEFVSKNKYFTSNTAFRHPFCHRITWTGKFKISTTTVEEEPINTGIIKPILCRNQIDYILIPQWLKHLLQDSRAYHGCNYNSDHAMVHATLNLQRIHIHHQHSTQADSPDAILRNLDIEQLIHDPQIRNDYRNAFSNRFQPLQDADSPPNDVFTQIMNMCHSAHP